MVSVLVSDQDGVRLGEFSTIVRLFPMLRDGIDMDPFPFEGEGKGAVLD